MSGDNEYRYNGHDAEFLERYIAALENLLRGEAWKYMERDLKASEQLLIDGMTETSNPNDMIRTAGKLVAIRNQLAWPSKMLLQAVTDLRRVRAANQKKESTT